MIEDDDVNKEEKVTKDEIEKGGVAEKLVKDNEDEEEKETKEGEVTEDKIEEFGGKDKPVEEDLKESEVNEIDIGHGGVCKVGLQGYNHLRGRVKPNSVRKLRVGIIVLDQVKMMKDILALQAEDIT